jgi:hypothetical protein
MPTIQRYALLLTIGVTGSLLAEPAAVRGGEQMSRIPGFFVEAARRRSGFLGYTAGMRLVLDARGVRMASAGGPLELDFEGANRAPVVEACEAATNRVSVFRGASRGWRSGLAASPCVRYRELYPGIDLVYRFAGNRLKSEFIVGPGASPSLIRLRYSGARRIAIDPSGNLIIEMARGQYREEAPYVYQQAGGVRKPISGRYRLTGGGRTAAFEVGAYDTTMPLIIDPAISFSTYFGGAGFDSANAVAVDAEGNVYIAGWTESYDLPVSGAVQRTAAGGVDAFVAKLDPAGTRLIYCTYLGGSGEDRATGIAVDSNGNVYVAGWTSSADFPVTAGVVQSRHGGGRDAFVAKIDASGSRLVYSTFLGSGGQDAATGIAIDSSGNAYLSGSTTSTGFPVYRAVQSSNRGQQDAFVAGLNASGKELLLSTYLGGMGNDSANAIAVDGSGGVYVAGDTASPNFPVMNAFQSATGGSQDAFAAKLTSTTGSLVYSTYLGGSGGIAGLPETAVAIDVDSSGNAYVAGTTSSSNFPVKAAFQSVRKGLIDSFLVKLTAGGNALVYATYLGGSSVDVGTAVRADSNGKVWVAGYTASSDFPMANPTQQSNAGAYDAFVACFNNTGAALDFSTYLGGTASDAASALAVTATSLYLAGQTTSADLPLQNAIQTFNGGGYGSLLAAFRRSELKPTAYLLTQDDATLAITNWAMAGSNQIKATPVANGLSVPSSHVTASSADGRYLLWQSDKTGLATFWRLSPDYSLEASLIAGDGSGDWRVVAMADFNGDNQEDLVWQNRISRAVTVLV